MGLKIYISVIFLCFIVACSGDKSPPKYQVDLNLPAEERWSAIYSNNKEHFKVNVKKAMSMIFSILPMRSKLEPLILKIADKIENDLPKSMADEIKGMAKALDMDVADFVVENILYDITAFNNRWLLKKDSRGFCTSIIAKDSNNNIWHARNLDYGLNTEFAKVLDNITMEIDFMKNGHVSYTATTYVGLTGLFTGQKPNVFTVSIDERNTGNILENLLMFLKPNVSLTGHLVRLIMDEASNFEEAVDMLANTPTPAPVYFIIGGVKPTEGAVITKSRLKAQDIWYLGQDKSSWYLVETNYDHWMPPPKQDDRRDVAIKAMEKVGQNNVNKESLFKVLSIPPVLNGQTTYTTIMSAANPKVYQTWLRST